MQTPSEFDSFFESKLLPILIDLEASRRKLLRAFILLGSSGILLSAVIIWFYIVIDINLTDFNTMLPLLAAGGGFGIFRIVHGKKLGEIRSRFKEEIVRVMVKFVDQTLEYSPYDGLQQDDYTASNLFHATFDRFGADDKVSGTLGQTAIRFSEVVTRIKIKTRYFDAYRTVFKGILFVADFNKAFAGKTMVVPDNAERLLGSIGAALQQKHAYQGELVRMENVEFEKLFAVYSTNQVEARYILSSSLMQRLVTFHQKSGTIHVSFVNSQLYIAIGVQQDLFESGFFRSMVTTDMVKEYYNYLSLMAGVVEDLNLNTRIWSKA